jgi:NAD(P)-dependent dehydrogenase (short-subunit alcohol dehydrogenase family)
LAEKLWLSAVKAVLSTDNKHSVKGLFMSSISFGLKDKNVLITGGSRGIGLEIAKLFLEQGARVSICGRKQEGLDAAAAMLNAGGRLLTVQAHAAKSEEVALLFERTLDVFGRIDVLINNVGMNLITTVVDADPAVWRKIIESNLDAAFLCSRKAGQIMRGQKSGKIVSISSLAASRSAPAMGVYGIAKAGIEMMTRVLAQELAPDVQVNAVAPGMVKTRFSQIFWSDPGLHDQIVKTIPLGRMAEPLDVAWPVLFLCSDAARYVTGQVLMVDGGASAV